MKINELSGKELNWFLSDLSGSIESCISKHLDDRCGYLLFIGDVSKEWMVTNLEDGTDFVGMLRKEADVLESQKSPMIGKGHYDKDVDIEWSNNE